MSDFGLLCIDLAGDSSFFFSILDGGLDFLAGEIFEEIAEPEGLTTSSVILMRLREGGE